MHLILLLRGCHGHEFIMFHCVYAIMAVLHAGAIAVAGAHFGEGSGPILLDNVECVGNEKRITVCPNQRLGQHNCHHSEDASVICQRKRSVV